MRSSMIPEKRQGPVNVRSVVRCLREFVLSSRTNKSQCKWCSFEICFTNQTLICRRYFGLKDPFYMHCILMFQWVGLDWWVKAHPPKVFTAKFQTYRHIEIQKAYLRWSTPPISVTVSFCKLTLCLYWCKEKVWTGSNFRRRHEFVVSPNGKRH